MSPITPETVGQVTMLGRWGKGAIGPVAYAADGSTFAIATSAGVVIYDAATLAERRMIDTGGPVSGLALSGDAGTLVTSGSTLLNSVQLWRSSDAANLGQVDGSAPIAISQDGRTLVVAKNGYSFDVWNVEDLTLAYRLPLKEYLSGGLIFSPDGQFFAATGGQNPAAIYVWRTSDGALVHRLNVPTQYVLQMVLSADNRSIATLSYDRYVRFWNLDDGALLHTMRFDGTGRLSPDASVLAVTREDRMSLLRTSDGATLSTVTIPGGSDPGGPGGASVGIYPRSFTPSGDAVMLSKPGSHGEIHLARVPDGTLVGRLDGFTTGIETVWFSPDDQSIMTAMADTVRVQRLADASLVSETTITPALAFSPDGQVVATRPFEEWSGSGPIRHVILRRLPGGEAYATLETSMPLAFSPDGSLLVTSTGIWHVADGTLAGTIEPPAGVQPGSFRNTGTGGCPSAVAISPDGTTLACGWSDGTLSLHRLADRALISTWQGHPGPPSRGRVPGALALAFSPDGTKLLSTSDSGTARLWQLPEGAQLGTANPYRDRLTPVAFSSDGSVAFLASQYGDLLLWPIGDGRPPSDQVTTVPHFRGQTSWIGAAPHGNTVVTATGGTLTFWGVK